VKEHSEILYAIENRLAEKASQMMQTHLENAINDFVKYGFVRFSHKLHNTGTK